MSERLKPRRKQKPTLADAPAKHTEEPPQILRPLFHPEAQDPDLIRTTQPRLFGTEDLSPSNPHPPPQHPTIDISFPDTADLFHTNHDVLKETVPIHLEPIISPAAILEAINHYHHTNFRDGRIQWDTWNTLSLSEFELNLRVISDILDLPNLVGLAPPNLHPPSESPPTHESVNLGIAIHEATQLFHTTIMLISSANTPSLKSKNPSLTIRNLAAMEAAIADTLASFQTIDNTTGSEFLFKTWVSYQIHKAKFFPDQFQLPAQKLESTNYLVSQLADLSWKNATREEPLFPELAGEKVGTKYEIPYQLVLPGFKARSFQRLDVMWLCRNSKRNKLRAGFTDLKVGSFDRREILSTDPYVKDALWLRTMSMLLGVFEYIQAVAKGEITHQTQAKDVSLRRLGRQPIGSKHLLTARYLVLNPEDFTITPYQFIADPKAWEHFMAYLHAYTHALRNIPTRIFESRKKALFQTQLAF